MKAMSASRSEPALQVFISYSRRDMLTADRMVSELERAGFGVTIDRRDLPYGEDWLAELAGFIRLCDTVVWLVSPQSVRSRSCNWELGEVGRLNKRLVPVAIEHVDPADLPEQLGKIHLLPAEGTFDFTAHMKALCATLERDSVWLKEHTRLAMQALHWQRMSRQASFLLRGRALTEAEAWKDRSPRGAPSPSPQILDLIMSSRRERSRRTRRWVALLGVATIAALVAAVFSLLQAMRADAALKRSAATVQEVVYAISRELATLKGVRPAVVREILDRSGWLMDDLLRVSGGHLELELSRLRVMGAKVDVYLAIGEIDAALETADRQIRLTENLEARYGRTDEILRKLSAAYGKMGDVLLQSDVKEKQFDAVGYFDKSAAIDKAVAESTGVNLGATGWTLAAISQKKLGDVWATLGDHEKAVTHYREALRALEIFDPMKFSYAAIEELVKTNLAFALFRLGRLEEAEKLNEEAIKSLRDYGVASGDNVESQLVLAEALRLAGLIGMSSKPRNEEARARLSESLSIAMGVMQSNPESVKAVETAIGTHLALADNGADAGRHLDAARDLSRKLDSKPIAEAIEKRLKCLANGQEFPSGCAAE